MLSRTSEVHASNSEFDYLSDVDSRTYQIIISKNYCEHNVMCPNHAIYDKKEYELRAVSSISIEENSLTKNDITFFSRHSGYHSKWWKDTRKMK